MHAEGHRTVCHNRAATQIGAQYALQPLRAERTWVSAVLSTLPGEAAAAANLAAVAAALKHVAGNMIGVSSVYSMPEAANASDFYRPWLKLNRLGGGGIATLPGCRTQKQAARTFAAAFNFLKGYPLPLLQPLWPPTTSAGSRRCTTFLNRFGAIPSL
ncbi:hypothetical protein ABPG75_006629 [Micractinium tetrahymenae]